MPGSNEVAVIVGGGPGVSASCARLFAAEGMKVAIAARTPGKPELEQLREACGAQPFECDATDPDSVDALFTRVESELGAPTLVVSGGRDTFTPEHLSRHMVETIPEAELLHLPEATHDPLDFDTALGLLVTRHPRLEAARAHARALNLTPGPSPLVTRARSVEGDLEELQFFSLPK